MRFADLHREFEASMTELWRSTFQTTIDAYYRGDLAEGREACERLLSVDNLPSTIDLQTRRNLVFYARPLAELMPMATARPIDIAVREGWSRFNPSIAQGPDGDLRMIVRSSNYTMTQQLRYTINDEGGVIRTINYLLDLSSNLEIADVQEIEDQDIRPEPPPFPVAGFEDCRLFVYHGSWWYSGTVRDRNVDGICQIALVRLDGATAVGAQLLSDDQDRRHEKNWMPAPGDDALRFVYSSSPTVILRYDDAGSAAPELIQPGSLIARRFSGGSQAIPIDGGWLCLVHEAVNFEDGGRVYTHRWVWFDAHWHLARLSSPFLLQERGVEFAAGLAHRDDQLLISYGVWDREAWLATVPVEQVLSLLTPPLDADEVEREMRAASVISVPDSVTSPAASPSTANSTLVAEPTDEGRVAAGTAFTGITPFDAQLPRIVSTTLTGSNREIIGDAVRSVVDWVDSCLLIDTGVSDDTLEIAREIAGDKLIVREFPWRDDFAAARNFALEAAAELGADWAVTLDSDERIVLGSFDVRSGLAASDADALHVKYVGDTYAKERFFRLPARGRYVGPTHEAFISEAARVGTLPRVLFDEIPKSAEDYRRKAERDVSILSCHTAEHPDDPRWFYYLGDSLAGLGRHDEAIAAFRICASLKGWDEEGAWAQYRVAEIFLKVGRPEEAVEACAAGMARHSGLAELPWLAAYASWQAGRPAQAAYWARLAVAMGNFAGAGLSVTRVGFRHPPGLWEGPYDVLRFALRTVGDDAGADEAERLFLEAKAAREDGERE
jgi:tetratricopeptide (TPR) repeat protein